MMQGTRQIDVRNALREGIARLAAAHVPSCELAAELLLLHALECDRAWLYAHSTDELNDAIADKYYASIARRAAGEPTQYITGKQEFWGLEFVVTPAVLIPRPETEHLIEVALDRLAQRRNDSLLIADVGTGSGCIAVALAKEFPNAEIIATDISPAALEIAKRNAARLGFASRINFIQADLLDSAFHDSRVTNHESRLFDLIVSNPPYISTDDPDLPREVRDHEPHQALFAGPTGLEVYKRLIVHAESKLALGGVLIMELGFGLAEEVRGALNSCGIGTDILTTNDLAGIPRVIAANKR